ncbi:aminopeptidase P family protein [Pediococcus argentinicus]|uniref:aminopeptidase P family protein n=1 Tax=Pediococcus argentinicus TaxID=480391 RepID=UPI00338ECD82
MEKINRIQSQLHQLPFDALLISDEFNLKYLTKFDGTAGDAHLLITTNASYFFTDARYETDLKEYLDPQIKLIITRKYVDEMASLLEPNYIAKLGFEDNLPYKEYSLLNEQLNLELIPTTELVDRARAIKFKSEINDLKEATRLSIEGFNYVLTKIKPGITEIEVSDLLDQWMKAHGSEGTSFETIVASGARAALPHGSATSKVIQNGELVTIDFGYFYNGYTSDITRTIAIGEPDNELKKIYKIVQEAQSKVIEAIKPGVSGKELDQIGRDYITEQGYGPQFNHGMGHGIGLNIHEYPQSYGVTPNYKVQENEVITVEPGIYIPDLGGVRIEDDILVTTDGHLNISADSDRDLIVL